MIFTPKKTRTLKLRTEKKWFRWKFINSCLILLYKTPYKYHVTLMSKTEMEEILEKHRICEISENCAKLNYNTRNAHVLLKIRFNFVTCCWHAVFEISCFAMCYKWSTLTRFLYIRFIEKIIEIKFSKMYFFKEMKCHLQLVHFWVTTRPHRFL